MFKNINLKRSVVLILLSISIVFGMISPPKVYATSDGIEINPILDTVQEKKVEKYDREFGKIPKVNTYKQNSIISTERIGYSLKTKVESGIMQFTRFINSTWQLLPDRVRGLIKGAGGGIIAGGIVLLLFFAGIVSFPAALVGVVLALFTGMLYGLYTGGEKYNWLLGVFIPLLAGVSAALIFENLGWLALKVIRPISYIGDKFSLFKAGVRPFIMGGLVNLTGYFSSHDYHHYTWWGIIGSFIIGGITGSLYGEIIVWLKEARYIALLSRYKWLEPVAVLAESKFGRFLMYNVFGGGLMGAVTTLAQNSFIGEKTTYSGLVAGSLSGFLASILICTTYMGLTRSVAKKIFKDFLESELTDFIKMKTENQIDKFFLNKTQPVTRAEKSR